MSQEFKRCSICDYTDMDRSVPRRDFVLDKGTNSYHCQECRVAISDAITDYEFEEYEWNDPIVPYWKRTEAHRRGGGQQNAGRKKKE